MKALFAVALTSSPKANEARPVAVRLAVAKPEANEPSPDAVSRASVPIARPIAIEP